MFTSFRRKILWIFIFALASLLSFGSKANATTYLEENILENDTIFTKLGSPYVISTLLIPENVTLTIEPGVEVKFKDSASLLVYGKVIAEGSKDKPIIFTSNSDDFASNTDDYELCLIQEYDEEGNLIKKEDCEYYDFYDPGKSSWDNIHLIDSTGSVFSNLNISYSNSAFTLQNSTATFSDISINDSRSGFNLFNGATANTKNVVINDVNRDAVVLFNDSFFSFDNLTISNVLEGAISVFNRTSFFGKDLKFNGNDFQIAQDAFVAFNDAQISLENSKFKDCPSYSCITIFDGRDFDGNPSSLNIKDTVFDSGAKFAISAFGRSPFIVNVSNSVFKGFPDYAFDFYPSEPNQSRINITNNYWNDATGPYHKVLNENGKGEKISEYYLGEIFPWLTSDPFLSCVTDCFSNIMFIPGMQGSRLYEANGLKDKELWFSRSDSSHEALFLDPQGKSMGDIYTKNDTRNNGESKETGIIDEAIFGINIYESLINELRGLKDAKEINDYSLIPYDWRLSLEDIIRNGKTFGDKNQNLSYLEPQAFDESFIYQELSKLAKSSKNGKVSIIAHSNGGLVTKALLQKLKDTEDPLYDKIDKIFLVAVPQIGTPEAVLALLYGTGLGPLDLIMDQDISRAFGENMPTLYNLLPRESYFNLVNNDNNKSSIVNFKDSKILNKEIEFYGENINSYKELSDFLLGREGREKPELYDTSKLNIANTYLYDNATIIYEMLDNWTPPSNTKVIQVGGWGMETLLGIDYKLYSGGISSSYLSYKNRKSIYGDKTVVLESSLYLNENNNIEKWYLDLKKSSKKLNKKIPFAHADILEIPDLLNFIELKIKNLEFEDKERIIVKDQSALISKQKNLIYTLHSPLYLGVFDTQGNFTGRDKDGNLKNEIPGVEYSQIGEVQTISIPVELAHTLTLYGYEEGVFALELDEFLNDTYSGNQLFQGIGTNKDTVAKLVFEGENSLDNLKLLVDIEGDGDFEEEYIPEKEEKIVEVKKVEDPGGVVLLNFLNKVIPETPKVLGATTEVLEDTELKNEATPTLENIQKEVTLNPKEVKEEPIIDAEITQEENPLVSKEIIKVENPKNNKPLIIFIVIVLLLISLKFLFKVL
jgi:hypothetical protein